jgi:hypothetical protein
MNILPIFCDVDDFCLLFEPRWHQRLFQSGAASDKLLLRKLAPDARYPAPYLQHPVFGRDLQHLLEEVCGQLAVATYLILIANAAYIEGGIVEVGAQIIPDVFVIFHLAPVK